MVALTLGENDLITDISVSGFDSVQEKFSIVATLLLPSPNKNTKIEFPPFTERIL